MCSECGDKFATKYTLANHKNNMHSELALCNRCGLLLKDKYQLSNHMKKCTLMCKFPGCQHRPFYSKLTRDIHMKKHNK